ncbi:MAG: hypothetical protein K9I68_04565 [Bacteroidales bacterium]|nr:hypothetical protein [Bacteroidales bacterium]MCF8337526.1 hypothetical protein [Bacteroidales bacterium]
MKRLILIFLASITIISVKSLEVYMTELYGSKNCYIYFYDDNNYKITLYDEVTIDMVWIFRLSYGSYQWEGNNVYLHDNYNDLNMVFKKKGDELMPVKAFLFLKNTSFKKRNEDRYRSSLNKYEISPLEQQIEEVKTKSIAAPITLRGTYRGGFSGHFRLFFTENNQYKYWYQDLLISKGEWRRENNIIKMQDAFLKHSFTMVVKNYNQLISLFLPRKEHFHLYKLYYPQPYYRVDLKKQDIYYKNF